eukprot:COSAG02_NODE_18910_length_911_cov_0.878079_2_plen_86_part_01
MKCKRLRTAVQFACVAIWHGALLHGEKINVHNHILNRSTALSAIVGGQMATQTPHGGVVCSLARGLLAQSTPVHARAQRRLMAEGY